MRVKTYCDCCGEGTIVGEETCHYFTVLITVPAAPQKPLQLEEMRICENCKRSLEETTDEEGNPLLIMVLSTDSEPKLEPLSSAFLKGADSHSDETNREPPGV